MAFRPATADTAVAAADGTSRATHTGHDGRVYGVAVAPDGTWLATADDDGTARTWNADGTPGLR